ncbi:MAG: dTDP-4-dehydrorhamnose 3,5-epimerase [Actinomycetota bacterium]|nr:dTDP-4-dehydrorhamnose 3,5-epimerase [Actinomycetota bacterium]
MIFRPTAVEDAYVIEIERIADDRGWFGRTYSPEGFAARGVLWSIVQCSLSFNEQAGTLRGLHYQAVPYSDAKLVRCSRGTIFDVAVDLRPQSPTYCRWAGSTLDAENSRAFFIPAGCAHGFLTLSDAAEVSYAIGTEYVPGAARGVRWDDPTFDIRWPSAPAVISERDAGYEDFLP